MSFLPCGNKPKKKHQKFNLIDLFRSNKKMHPSEKSTNTSETTHKQFLKTKINAEQQKLNKFVNELAEEKVSFQQVQKLSWDGIPHCLRPKIWKYLLRYALLQGTEEMLTKKRQEYQLIAKNYWKPISHLEDKKVFHTIDGDVKRIGSEFNEIFKNAQIQQLLKRLLYVWHMRHPASGYVQGMCDIVTPFLTVFLSEYIPFDTNHMEFQLPIQALSSDILRDIEADCYWCMSKMLEYVVKNYTKGFGGQHQAYSKVQELLYRIDEELYKHLMKEKIDLFSLSFRCISTMMLRMFQPLVGIRLFDTFISYEEEYPTLMIYLIIAIIEKFAKEILSKKGDDLMQFVGKLPTKSWNQYDVGIIVAEAYVYKKIFSGNN